VSDRRKAEAGERLLASAPALLSDGSALPVAAPVTSPPSPSSPDEGSERNAAR
jgi:hypothetical protein